MRLPHLPQYPIFVVSLGLTMLVCIFLFINFNGGVSNAGTSEFRTSSSKFGSIWQAQPPKYYISQPSSSNPGQKTSAERVNRSSTLSIASQIFVVSLPRRTDRRAQMEILRSALGLQWKYVEAIDNSSPFIPIIMEEVRKQRTMQQENKKPFRWPKYISAQAYSSEPLGLDGSDNWTLPKYNEDINMQPRERNISASYRSTIASDPLTCATEDDTLVTFEKGLQEYKLLTQAKIACWISHLSVIRDIAEDKNEDVSIVLEDDINMGWDIKERLNGVWNLLPAGWDIVFIGEDFPPIPTTMTFLNFQVTAGQMNPTTSLSVSPTPNHAQLFTLPSAPNVRTHMPSPTPGLGVSSCTCVTLPSHTRAL